MTAICPHIRAFAAPDTTEVMRLFHDTVLAINSRDYTPAQIEAWAPANMDEAEWRQFLLSKPTYVADLAGKIVGFAQLEPNGHIDCFYCHHRHQRQRIGTLLIGHIETIATRSRITRLFTDASITARPFFERHGFRVVREQHVAPNGERMRNFAMEKKPRRDSQNS